MNYPYPFEIETFFSSSVRIMIELHLKGIKAFKFDLFCHIKKYIRQANENVWGIVYIAAIKCRKIILKFYFEII